MDSRKLISIIAAAVSATAISGAGIAGASEAPIRPVQTPSVAQAPAGTTSTPGGTPVPG